MSDLIDLNQVRKNVDAALQMIRCLCQPKNSPESREWVMSIPAKPDHDPDLVIGRAVAQIPLLVKQIEELRAEVIRLSAQNQTKPSDYSKGAILKTDVLRTGMTILGEHKLADSY